MLFTFNKTWKTLLTIISAWIIYACVGFEFTTITLLSLLVCGRYLDS